MATSLSDLRLHGAGAALAPALVQGVLISACEETVIPEIFEVFGHEAGIKFLDIFGGSRLDVPGLDVLETCVRDIDIYMRLKDAADARERSRIIVHMARKYEIENRTVRRIEKRLRALEHALGAP